MSQLKCWNYKSLCRRPGDATNWNKPSWEGGVQIMRPKSRVMTGLGVFTFGSASEHDPEGNPDARSDA